MAEQPKRLQRSRAKGWRMPPGAVSVSRPSRWSNRWVAELGPGGWRCQDTHTGLVIPARDRADAHDLAVSHYKAWVTPHTATIQAELRGQDLCCWCKPELRCHADVLLELANAPLVCEAADG